MFFVGPVSQLGGNHSTWRKLPTCIRSSAWNGRSPSRQMRLISYSGDQKLLQIRTWCMSVVFSRYCDFLLVVRLYWYNFMWDSLSVTCCMSVVLSRDCGFLLVVRLWSYNFMYQSLWHGVQRFYHSTCIFHINLYDMGYNGSIIVLVFSTSNFMTWGTTVLSLYLDWCRKYKYNDRTVVPHVIKIDVENTSTMIEQLYPMS
jgi:hypothetical protein